jgi:hypothetical protein
LVVLTIIIFLFSFVSFRQILKSERVLIEAGKRDEDIIEEKGEKKKKSYKVLAILSSAFSFVVVGLAVSIMALSLVVKGQGQLIFIGGKSSLVIASNSMSVTGDEKLLSENGGYLTPSMVKEQFRMGDILTMDETPSESTMLSKNDEGEYYRVNNGSQFPSSYASPYLNDVFVFRFNNENIVHRLVSIDIVAGKTFYTFQGDKYAGSTQTVQYDKLVAIYDGHSKVATWGYGILFFSSSFGIYSVAGSISMIVMASIFSNKVEKLYDERLKKMGEEKSA